MSQDPLGLPKTVKEPKLLSPMYLKKHRSFVLSCLHRQQSGTSKLLGQFSTADWDHLIESSICHGVAPLIFTELRNQSNCQKAAMVQLAAAYLSVAQTNNIYFEEFKHVFKKLKEEYIPFIVLKGPHLAEIVYKNISLRPFGDFDILVKGKDLLRASSALNDIGYLQTESPPQAADHHLPRFVKEGVAPIEIHWNIHDSKIPTKVDIPGLWRRAQWANIAGGEVLTLSPEDLILHLCLHICQHNFHVGLRAIYDIHKTMETYQEELNWEELTSRAHDWLAAKHVFLVLEVVKDLLGTELPEGMLSELRPDDLHLEIVAWAKDQILESTSIVSHNLAEAYRSEKLKHKIELVFKSVFRSEKEFEAQHPDIRNSLQVSRLGRFKYLFKTYGEIIVEMFKHQKEDLIIPDKKKSESLREWLSTK
jgi:hypothetical protein